MRIYVASLSDYNAGVLHGIWIDLDTCSDADDVQEQVNTMLRASKYPNVQVACPACDGTGVIHEDGIDSVCPDCKGTNQVPSAEEWAIHDYEMEGIEISESEGFETCIEIKDAYDSHGEAFKVAYDNFSDIKDAVKSCEESYQGVHKSLENWAENFAEETGMLSEIPENLRYYFDWEKYARDCELSGDIWTAEGNEGLHVFWNR